MRFEGGVRIRGEVSFCLVLLFIELNMWYFMYGNFYLLILMLRVSNLSCLDSGLIKSKILYIL